MMDKINISSLIPEIRAYIEDNLLRPLSERRTDRVFGSLAGAGRAVCRSDAEPCMSEETSTPSVEDYLKAKDESYVDMLFRKIDERGMTDADCYKKAQINKANFNKIKNVSGYRAKKTTLIALGLALELSEDELKELLEKAGYALSCSSEADLIIKFCLEHGIYDIDDINGILFEFDQELLGAGVRD